MNILAIETSCDETAIALVEATGGLKRPRFKVIENLVASQIETHRPYGGVVPNLAKREHQKNLPKILRRLNLNKYRGSTSINLIAVTVGPGLEPCLWAGIEFAKELAKKIKKPLIGANHLEGHMYSPLLSNPKHEAPSLDSPRRGGRNSKQIKNSNDKNSKHFGFRYSNFEFPAITLLVSGGHTILLKMDSLTKWKKLGETRDDAAGEAFDKVARLLGLPYPGGPELEKLAKKGDPKAINFPRPMISDKNYEFSFSGLKTSVLYYLRDGGLLGLSRPVSLNGMVSRQTKTNANTGSQNSNRTIADVAASFQQAIVDVLVKKTMRAAVQFGAKSVLLCGGVAANKALRAALSREAQKTGARFPVPDFQFNTDNAAMIAAAAYIKHLQKKKYKLSAKPNLNL